MSSAANLYANYNKLAMPYSMASMYMSNPMYAASLASLGYMAQLQKDKEPGEITEAEEQKDEEVASGDEKDKEAEATKTSPGKSLPSHLAHPSFPFMYNPMLYAQSLYAQSLAAANFTLPTGMPTSFGTLAQMNGVAEADSDKEEAAKSGDEQIAQDLSVKAQPATTGNHDSDQPLNLDMKAVKKVKTTRTGIGGEQDQPLELTKSSSRRKQAFVVRDKHKEKTPVQEKAEDLSKSS